MTFWRRLKAFPWFNMVTYHSNGIEGWEAMCCSVGWFNVCYTAVVLQCGGFGRWLSNPAQLIRGCGKTYFYLVCFGLYIVLSNSTIFTHRKMMI